MKSIAFSLILLLIAFAVGTRTGASELKSIPIDEGFSHGSFGLSRGSSGVEYRWTMMPIQGDLHVCGALKLTGHGSSRITRQIIRDMRFKLSQFEVLRGGEFFAVVPRDTGFDAARAICKPTGVTPPQGRFPISVEFPKKAYR